MLDTAIKYWKGPNVIVGYNIYSVYHLAWVLRQLEKDFERYLLFWYPMSFPTPAELGLLMDDGISTSTLLRALNIEGSPDSLHKLCQQKTQQLKDYVNILSNWLIPDLAHIVTSYLRWRD